MSNQPPFFSIQPLIPLPPSSGDSDRPPSPTSPFSSLFAPPPQSQSQSTSPRPLFPNSSHNTPRATPGPPTLQPVTKQPSNDVEDSTFGEFVSSDPLQEQPSFSPLESPQTGRNAFVQEATERHKARGAKVMEELVGRDDDDPLGWLSGPTTETINGAKPFEDWDGLEDDEQVKEEEMLEEIAAHARLPHTPHASRGGSPEPYNSDEDIIDLKTGQRGRHVGRAAHHHAARPIPISSSKAKTPTQPHHTSNSSSGSYLGFTLPRKWFSSSMGPSPPSAMPSTSGSLPPAGITRQSSVGEFTPLPPADLSPYGGSFDKASPKPTLSTFFEVSGPLPSPFAKKAYIPPTGAPAFVPDDNWNPSGFEYDSHSKKDTMGSEKLNLVGRSDTTITVLSQDVADKLRPSLPPLPRLARNWTLLYSTDQHGMSIGTLYKNVEKFYGVPGGCILAVREVSADGDEPSTPRCFGVWLGSGMKCQDGSYYGSGESFLWKTNSASDGLVDGVKVFKWTGRNDYVALCEADYLSFGGGDGKYGLYVDSAFVDGTSERCDTFSNEVLCGDEDSQFDGRARFECLALEVWRVGGP